MLFAVLAFAAVVLTYAMFQSRSSMLGFPCGIFWAILGGYCYLQTAGFFPPVDIYALLGIASLLGMTPFTIYAAYALKTKKEEVKEGDQYFDEGADKDIKYIDEDGKEGVKKDRDSGTESQSDSDRPGRRSRDIRDRASRRRSRWE